MKTSDILKTTCWSIGLTKSKHPATFSIIQLISGLVLLFHIHTNGGWVGHKTRNLEIMLTSIGQSLINHWTYKWGTPSPELSEHGTCTSSGRSHFMWIMIKTRDIQNSNRPTTQLSLNCTGSSNTWIFFFTKHTLQNYTICSIGWILKFGEKRLWSCHVCCVQSCLTLCNSMDCSPPGSPFHGILQTRILEWVVISFSRGSQPRDRTPVSSIAGGFFTHWATRDALRLYRMSSQWSSESYCLLLTKLLLQVQNGPQNLNPVMLSFRL